MEKKKVQIVLAHTNLCGVLGDEYEANRISLHASNNVQAPSKGMNISSEIIISQQHVTSSQVMFEIKNRYESGRVGIVNMNIENVYYAKYPGLKAR